MSWLSHYVAHSMAQHQILSREQASKGERHSCEGFHLTGLMCTLFFSPLSCCRNCKVEPLMLLWQVYCPVGLSTLRIKSVR